VNKNWNFMEQIKWLRARVLSIVFILLGIQTLSFAQDSSSTTTTTTTKSTIEITETESWFASPWVWIVGVAVFILLLVALLGGRGRDKSGRTDKVTVTKTVRTDTDA
jgi:hypothetical protein